jgi:DNA-binding XRE family transcriptional regulator
MEFTQELTSDLARSKRMRVRSLREQGYTLRGLAEFVGMSYQRIQQIETGMTARDRAKEKSGRK